MNGLLLMHLTSPLPCCCCSLISWHCERSTQRAQREPQGDIAILLLDDSVNVSFAAR